MNRTELKDLIIRLADSIGVSGDEFSAADAALSELRRFIPDAEISGGNVLGTAAKDCGGTVVLDAHIDQIGLIVTDIDDSGFIKVGNVGGVDLRLMAAQEVIIHGSSAVHGVVCSTPPHLSDGDDKVVKISEISIDCGMTKEAVSGLISAGDRITFADGAKSMLGSRISGHALDNRCGVAAVLYALSLTDMSKLKRRLCVCFTSSEEVGERGAKTAAFISEADTAIVVDVSFAYSDGEKREKCGELGKGCMIGISPTLDRALSNEMISISKEAEIPYQLEVMSGETGTNADQYSVIGCGAKAVTLSVPLRYMHTPVEVIDVSDVEATGRIIAEYIRRCC